MVQYCSPTFRHVLYVEYTTVPAFLDNRRISMSIGSLRQQRKWVNSKNRKEFEHYCRQLYCMRSIELNSLLTKVEELQFQRFSGDDTPISIYVEGLQ